MGKLEVAKRISNTHRECRGSSGVIYRTILVLLVSTRSEAGEALISATDHSPRSCVMPLPEV